MNKLGFAILSLVWVVSYFLKHIDPVNNQLAVDYFITCGYCIGTALIAYFYGKRETNRKTRILFFYTIAIYNISIVFAYLVDFIADSLFGTTKLIWTIIITTTISLCIYFFKRNN